MKPYFNGNWVLIAPMFCEWLVARGNPDSQSFPLWHTGKKSTIPQGDDRAVFKGYCTDLPMKNGDLMGFNGIY